MPKQTTSLRIDMPTRDRLAALAALVGQPMGEVVRTLSYADVSLILQTTARRAAHETAEDRRTGDAA